MWNRKVAKGQYGYLKKQKIWSTARTLILFALSLSIFAIGIKSTGSKENLLTVVAILGCLPAGRSAVNMIMFLRTQGCSEEVMAQIRTASDGMIQLYDMFFTSYEKNYPISHMVINNHVVCGYAENPKMDSQGCEKHLNTYLKKGGCKSVAVKIFVDLEKYCEGINNLKRQAETEPPRKEGHLTNEEQEILENLLSIAL
ncbi:hypothetical protein D3Z45_07390 [Lachnospiraceae bacterium]|nr:hypothetical protein [Lachnospiraceae bacterium]